MSVDVHTSPTAIPLSHKWEPMKSPRHVFSDGETSAPIDQRRYSYSGPRKRRFQHYRGNFQTKRRRHSSRSQMILPSKFLLGGNISDPLNLNGLSESDEITPVSSPLPTGHRDNVSIIIPPNITDPLNLVESDDDANDELFYNLSHKKKKHKRKNTKEKEVKEMTLGPLNIDVNPVTPRRPLDAKVISPAIPKDKIVSPVIPQTNPRAWKRRRTASEGPQPIPPLKLAATKEEEEPNPSTAAKIEPPKPTPKTKRQNSNPKTKKKDRKGAKFINGNYSRYYGYRNPNATDDARIRYFESGWFAGKDVLDVGCNSGHVTLAIARDFQPQKIVGVDIDSYLVGVARKNIRHYLLTDEEETKRYPVSMATCYGPLSQEKLPEFPANVFFRQGDFVLESDELLDLQKPEYDVILALSLTKWIHLNHGDAGLKRTFKRFYRMLRPGGKLILEPQGFASYGKRKKLTDTIFKNYQSIRFRPEHFKDFLMSRHVGFSACLQLDIPFNKAQGFRRPIFVFTKQSLMEPSVTFDVPVRLPYRPAPLTLDQNQTPNSTTDSTSRMEASAPGTPFSAPGTPGYWVPGAPFSYAPSPCSVQSCSECKRRVENGFTPGTESSVSLDYCSQCSGSLTPGKWSAGARTPASTGARTPASHWSSEGAQTCERTSDDDGAQYGGPLSCDPATPGDPLSCDPATPGDPLSCDPATPGDPATGDLPDHNYEPHTPLEVPPPDQETDWKTEKPEPVSNGPSEMNGTTVEIYSTSMK